MKEIGDKNAYVLAVITHPYKVLCEAFLTPLLLEKPIITPILSTFHKLAGVSFKRAQIAYWPSILIKICH